MRPSPEPCEGWKALASAFFALAHGSRAEYDALPVVLRESQVGKLCGLYLENRDPDLLDQAGLILTGSRDWYTFLGRVF
ncbi:MAG: hypothetical protein R6V62_10330 [Candidatus Fermentibacteraceae bacterium]